MSKTRVLEEGIGILHVAKLTGLTIHTLRAWEKRYGAVKPGRPGRNRRYTYSDVERFRELKSLVESGVPIRKAVRWREQDIASHFKLADLKMKRQREELISLLGDFNLTQVATRLRNYRVRKTVEEFLLNLVTPLMAAVGHLVEQGKFSIAQEHVLTALVRDEITKVRAKGVKKNSPIVAFCTPEGDFHELGILMASRLASAKGFNAINFGANLPAESLIELDRALKPSLIVIAATAIKENRSQLTEYLARVNAGVRPKVELRLAGPLAMEFSGHFKGIDSMEDFQQQLKAMR